MCSNRTCVFHGIRLRLLNLAVRENREIILIKKTLTSHTMNEKTSNTLWGCLVILFVAALLGIFAYGAVTLFQDLVGIR